MGTDRPAEPDGPMAGGEHVAESTACPASPWRVLGDVLGGTSAADFLLRYQGKAHLHVTGSTGKFSSLITWEDLNGILERYPLGDVRLRLFKEGAELPRRAFCTGVLDPAGNSGLAISAPDLQACLRDGATLIVNSIDELHAPIRILSQGLEHALRVPVHVNMYASWRTSRGFTLHWDFHDVFILQLAGRKDWRIYGETEPHPLDKNHEATLKPPECGHVWEGSLRDGDVLYIPRGWWHVAVPCDEPTLHLTVAMTYPTGLDLFKWVGDRLRADADMRADLPVLPGDQRQAEHALKIRAAILRVLDEPGLLNGFLQHLDDTALPRRAFSLPWGATPDLLPPGDDWQIEVAAPRALSSRPVDGNGSIAMGFAGKELRFEQRTSVLFDYLTHHHLARASDFLQRFEGEFPREHLVEFLSDLVERGVVVPRAILRADGPT